MYDVVTEAVETGYITFDEAYDLMPYEMISLIKGRQNMEERETNRGRLFFGALISTYINMKTPKNARKFKWDEIFMTSVKEQSDEEIERTLDAFERLLGD